jgi:hypothetical protein
MPHRDRPSDARLKCPCSQPHSVRSLFPAVVVPGRRSAVECRDQVRFQGLQLRGPRVLEGGVALRLLAAAGVAISATNVPQDCTQGCCSRRITTLNAILGRTPIRPVEAGPTATQTEPGQPTTSDVKAPLPVSQCKGCSSIRAYRVRTGSVRTTAPDRSGIW